MTRHRLLKFCSIVLHQCLKYKYRLAVVMLLLVVVSICYYYYFSGLYRFKYWKGKRQEEMCEKLLHFNVNGSSLSTYHYDTEVNCEAFFGFNRADELGKSQCQGCYTRNSNFEKSLFNLSKNCADFRLKFTQCSFRVTETELSFPIAFGILVYKDKEQVMRLLRAIYRPHNYYCFHIDIKASNMFVDTLHGLTKCYTNVFVSSKSADVRWGKFSVVEAELHCLRDLYKYKKWKYFINLAGQDFPLKTNWELVQILKAYNGSNDIDGTIRDRHMDWFQYHCPPEKGRPRIRKSPPPDGITVVRGSTHIAASRGFVEYMLFNETALRYLEWVKDVHVPDEYFFPTLNHNPQLGAPGAYKGDPDEKFANTRLKI